MTCLILALVLVGVFLLMVGVFIMEQRHARAFREETKRMCKEIEDGTWNGDFHGKEW